MAANGIPMQKSNKTAEVLSVLERRDVSILLSAVLFGTNFLLFYFIFYNVFKDITGFMRLALCWVGAYAMTWTMTFMAKGAVRLIITVILLGMLFIVFRYQP